jgi:ATP-dependent DNA helicase RecG
MNPTTPILELSYVGPETAIRFKKLGIQTLRDLLFYFPKRYEDYSTITPIAKVKKGGKMCLKAKVLSIQTRRTPRKKMFLTEAIIEDNSGALSVIWFNQPFVTRQLKKGCLALFVGSIQFNQKKMVLSSPSYELIAEPGRNESVGIHGNRIIPIYGETNRITSKFLRLLIWINLQHLQEIKEHLPPAIIKRNGLMPLEQALKEIHFPHSFPILNQAKKRLSFDELFLIRIYLERRRFIRETKERSFNIPFDKNLVQSFVRSLSFKLTDDQKRAAWQIIKDMEKPYPMQRLLEGDVGSGKTIVAAIASLSVIHAGYQVAIMAPTEVLARQHFNQLSKDLKKIKNITIALLVSAEARIFRNQRSIKIKKERLLKNLTQGKINMIIGTHALIQKNVKFKNLAFVVVDEQHRFGVEQRAQLLNCEPIITNGFKPEDKSRKIKANSTLRSHLLSMSATPIPRTLSLVFYGDLNISQLKEMPKGRKKIDTKIIFPKERQEIYEFIRKEVKKGRQAFVICPLIEESEIIETRAAEKEFERLSKKIFPDLRMALLHGRKKSVEKKEIMVNFTKKKIDILVSTSVIEVGIDVPNATIMMIEGSERFGLAQLHQLRGRVGRGKYKSYCFLLTEMPSRTVISRLRALTRIEDGFKLAEKDLAIRGPGDFIGHRQSGIPDLIMASLKDINLINLAKKEASLLLKKDPELINYPLLKAKLQQMASKIHLE